MLSAKFSSEDYGVVRFGLSPSSPLRFTLVKFSPIFNLVTCLFGFQAKTKFSCANSGQLQAGLKTNFTSFHFQIQLTYYRGQKVLTFDENYLCTILLKSALIQFQLVFVGYQKCGCSFQSWKGFAHVNILIFVTEIGQRFFFLHFSGLQWSFRLLLISPPISSPRIQRYVRDFH